MGLDTTHGAWHGAYSAFHRWRCEVARAAWFPPLELMQGFFDLERHDHELISLSEYSWLRNIIKHPSLPISWDAYKKDGLVHLLYHEDSDGYLTYGQCGKIAKRLREILPNLEGDFGGHIGDIKQKTLTFIEGCELAHKKKEKLLFR